MKLPHDASALWNFFYILFSVFRPLLCRVTVDGAEHLPYQGGCVLVCNHTFGPDFLLLGYGCPRQIYFMAKTEIFSWHPWLTAIFHSAGVFPVDRGRGDVVAFSTAVEIVRQGRVLGMFPEGTRSPNGQLLRGKSGAARIAMQAQAPVIPAVVIGAPLVLKQLGRRWRSPHVTVRFGPPLCLTGNPDDLAEARQNTERMMRAMAALLPSDLRGDYQ